MSKIFSFESPHIKPLPSPFVVKKEFPATKEQITMALEQLQKHNLPQRLIVDCSHDNSSRNDEKQGFVFRSVIEQYAKGNAGIRGLILESHLFSGNQTLSNNGSGLKYAVSLTDPCLDWDTTEELIEWAASKLKGIQDKASVESTQEALCVE